MTTETISAEFTIPKRKKTNLKGVKRWIFSHFIKYWYLGLVIILGAFGNAYLAAVVPVKIGEGFDAILQEVPNIAILGQIAWFIIISQIIRGGLQFARNFGAEWIGQLMERDVREELYTSLLGKSMTFHNLQPVGDTMARATNDVREVNFMFSPGVNLVVGSANFLLMPLLLAPGYHPSLMIAPALFIIAYFIALWQYLRELSPITDEVRGSFGKMNTRLAETLDGIEVVKGMAQEFCEMNLFYDKASRFRNAFVKQGDIEARFLPLLLLGLAQAGGLLHSIILYQQGLIALGDVVAYYGLLQLFGFPTFTSLFAYSQISLGLAGGRRILELINRKTDLDQNVEGYAGEMRGEIEFKNVNFGYDDNDLSLENINFRIKPGQTVAIVGQTGSGKSSLTKLINRTYDVREGQVLVDGIDVRDWQLKTLRENISSIEQDIFLFSRKLSNNIAFGKPGIDQEQVLTAARQAQADEFISELAEGYDTVIGERGVTLSGGQRQRIALARAFLTDPRILVLDDSTSAIDSATEDKIQRAINNAAKGRTTLIITHRLSQIRWADLIIVMRNGKIAASGSHDELMATSEAYRRIFSE